MGRRSLVNQATPSPRSIANGWVRPYVRRSERFSYQSDYICPEFLTTSLFYASPPEHARALSLILAAFDPEARSLGGLSRELLDIGVRSAIACKDTEHAVELARSGMSLVSGHYEEG